MTYQDEIERERAARVGRLTAEDGWLALVARHFLEPGENRLPFGTVTLDGGVARLRVAPGVAMVDADGRPVTERVLRSDAQGPPDVLGLGSQRIDLVQRGPQLSIRVKDPAAPARTGFRGLAYYPIEPRWRVVARVVGPPRIVQRPATNGNVVEEEAPGTLVFDLLGGERELTGTVAGERLHIVFSDLTNRDTTYGAGRFLYTPLPERGLVVLDFNLAMSPPCAFTDLAVCPVTPPENRLAIRIEAGELSPDGVTP